MATASRPFASSASQAIAGMGPRDLRRWQQVLAREAAADGLFVYAVRTTGIFCRPACPSRRPLPRNVLFFRGPAEARAAGFRPCRRCHPETHTASTRCAAVSHAARQLAQDSDRQLPLAELGRRAGLSRLALHRSFRSILGVTPGEFARASRVGRFREALASGSSRTVTDAIYAAGFGSSSRVYEGGRSRLGMTPGELRQAGGGLTIWYLVTQSPLGPMLVAATETGVCAILFGEDTAALTADLQRRFRHARLIPAETASAETARWLSDAVRFVLSQLTESPLARSFPLDIRATAFQERIWKALQAIPRGETRCYSDIAAEIGRPTAVRAVGAAIGANPLAIAVPCHRVLGKDGSLTGYHWGLDRKRRLLAAEAPRKDADPT